MRLRRALADRLPDQQGKHRGRDRSQARKPECGVHLDRLTDKTGTAVSKSYPKPESGAGPGEGLGRRTLHRRTARQHVRPGMDGRQRKACDQAHGQRQRNGVRDQKWNAAHHRHRKKNAIPSQHRPSPGPASVQQSARDAADAHAREQKAGGPAVGRRRPPAQGAAASARAIISLTTAVLASAYCCVYFQSRVANSRFVRA
jgi:hypothetical protein